ncbi:MAG: hypothetical protein R3228_15780 [Halioglobus sp.]|nr:hypothetical protein [Halioglobus sp.]
MKPSDSPQRSGTDADPVLDLPLRGRALARAMTPAAHGGDFPWETQAANQPHDRRARVRRRRGANLASRWWHQLWRNLGDT